MKLETRLANRYWDAAKLRALVINALGIYLEIYQKRFVVPEKRFRFAAAFEGGSDTISVKIEPKNASSLQVVLVFSSLEKKVKKNKIILGCIENEINFAAP